MFIFGWSSDGKKLAVTALRPHLHTILSNPHLCFNQKSKLLAEVNPSSHLSQFPLMYYWPELGHIATLALKRGGNDCLKKGRELATDSVYHTHKRKGSFLLSVSKARSKSSK